jgi:Ca2+-binding RTX toxin-like protein
MATYDGTSGNDTINGSTDDDVISGHGGDDQLFGDDGADEIDGGADLSNTVLLKNVALANLHQDDFRFI